MAKRSCAFSCENTVAGKVDFDVALHVQYVKPLVVSCADS